MRKVSGGGGRTVRGGQINGSPSDRAGDRPGDKPLPAGDERSASAPAISTPGRSTPGKLTPRKVTPGSLVLAGLVLGGVVVGGLALPARADIVHLKDGDPIEGEVRRAGEGWAVVRPDGTTRYVPDMLVERIELTGKHSVLDGAESLASLRRSVEQVTAPAEAVRRYERFIAQFEGKPVADEAAQDLEVWRRRADEGEVKIAGKWLTRQEAQALSSESNLLIAQAASLLNQNQSDQARPLIDQALAVNPSNPAALYLGGTMAYGIDNAPVARQNFEDALNVVPRHGPTLNNLAVVLWRQNQHGQSLATFERAMEAWPEQRLLLDNVAETLNELPDTIKSSPVAKRVQRLFERQDTALQAQLANQGIFRWGATWVTREELAVLQQKEKEVQVQLDKLAGQFDESRQRVSQIDNEIADTTREMRRLEARSYGVDTFGQPVRVLLPSVYQELQRDLDQLQRQKEAEVRTLDSLRQQAKDIQQRIPTPRYSGQRQLAGPELAPVEVMAAG